MLTAQPPASNVEVLHHAATIPSPSRTRLARRGHLSRVPTAFVNSKVLAEVCPAARHPLLPPCAWVRRVACNWASQLLVVLQSVQPLTTDVRAVGLDEVVVLTDGPETGVTRADAPVPPEVRVAARDKWGETLSEWARSSAVEVVTNDEFCLSECARLRQAMGLERRTPEALDAYLDKVDMKTRLAASVPVPRWD